MITQISANLNETRIFGTKTYPNGIINKGCLVILISMDLNKEIKRTVTDRFGKFLMSFTENGGLPSGKYQVRFYGSNYPSALAPEGDWETFIFQNPSENTGIEDIVFNTIPTMQITEGETKTDVNNNEYTVVYVDLMHMKTAQGIVKEISLFGKNSEHPTSAYSNITTFDYVQEMQPKIIEIYDKESDRTYTSDGVYVYSGVSSFSNSDKDYAEFHTTITLPYKPINYDFYCIFINPLGRAAAGNYLISGIDADRVYNYSISGWEDNEDGVLKIYDRDVYLNGIPDLQEYAEVRKLKVVSASENLEYGALKKPLAELQWEEIRDLPPSYFPIRSRNGYNGEDMEINYQTAKQIISYVVYMYVAENIDDEPYMPEGVTVPYPGSYSGWYFMGEYTTANASIVPPAERFVGFWVGMKTSWTDINKRIHNTTERLSKDNTYYSA